MGKNGREFLFNTIAPVYGLFFNYQRHQFIRSLEQVKSSLDLKTSQNVLDVGCGTGALCSVLHEKGLAVTGIDPSAGMLKIARRKLSGQKIDLIEGNVLERLPFSDKSFDVSIASFVAHGLLPDERRKMYHEMSRLTRTKVLIYDYNQKRSLLTTLVEWLERGDYFRFIRQAESEMVNCFSDLKQCFSSVEVVQTSGQAAIYVCSPKD